MTDIRRVTLEDYKKPHPIYVVWELTLRCDQACKHCGSRAGAARGDELNTEEAMDLIDQMADIGVREVTLIGGESYLRPDWLELVAKISKRGMVCSIVSGGRKFDLEKAKAAKAAGVKTISISVDGLADTHDSLRNVPGSHKAAMAAIDAVRKAGIMPAVNTQINTFSKKELVQVYEEILSHGVKAWQLQITTPMGRAADEQALVLQPYEMIEVIDTLAKLAARKQGLRVMASNNVGYFGPHEEILRAGAHWIGCPAGKFSLGVQSNGVIKGCSSLPADPYAAKSIREAPLSQIYSSDPALDLIRKRTVQDLKGFCRNCYYAEICLAGCVWTAHTFMNEPLNMPYCYHRAEQLALSGYRERIIPVAPAPGKPFDTGFWRLELEKIPNF